jgi:uncharacterized surface protein with fasciclin (FAS1) repeats
MRLSRRTAATTAAAATVAVAALSAVPAAAAPADKSAMGHRSLAKVLLSDGNRFDKNPYDFDVVTELALWTLKNKPSSDVAVLTKGNVALTAFIPTDRAFAKLVTALTGKTPKSEWGSFNAVKGLGLKTVESVLLYHVVPGATITAKQALASDGAVLTTALAGKTFTVKVNNAGTPDVSITLVDNAPARPNPRVVLAKTDINKGNVQIAHGISRVLLPAAL